MVYQVLGGTVPAVGDVVVVVVVVGGVPVHPQVVVAPGECAVERVEVVVDVVVEGLLALAGDADPVGQAVTDGAGVVDTEFAGIARFAVGDPTADFAAEAGTEAVEVGLLAQVVDVAAAATDRTVGDRGGPGNDVGTLVGVEVGGVAYAVGALAILEHLGVLPAHLRGDTGVLAATAGNAGGVLDQVISALDRVAGQLLGVDLGDRAWGVEDLGFQAAVDRGGWARRQGVVVSLFGLHGDRLQGGVFGIRHGHGSGQDGEGQRAGLEFGVQQGNAGHGAGPRTIRGMGKARGAAAPAVDGFIGGLPGALSAPDAQLLSHRLSNLQVLNSDCSACAPPTRVLTLSSKSAKPQISMPPRSYWMRCARCTSALRFSRSG
ncbi:hypothetical protein D3C76_671550 [compost metagenome]